MSAKSKIEGEQQARVDTLRACWSLIDAYRDGFRTLADLEFLGYKRADIERATKAGAIIIINQSIHMGSIHWKQELLGEVEPPAPERKLIAPQLDGLKVKNEATAHEQGYFLYTGYRSDTIFIQAYLKSLGIDCGEKENGHEGRSILTVPVWFTGQIIIFGDRTEREKHEQHTNIAA